MKDSTKKRILIVEDNPTFQKMLKLRLESNGYDVIAASDGLEGLSMARKEKPDLIILDLMLPGMNGHQIARLLKFDRRFQDIPIIMLTSRDLDNDAALAKQCGADAFIVKTTKAAILLEVIKKLLVRKNTVINSLNIVHEEA